MVKYLNTITLRSQQNILYSFISPIPLTLSNMTEFRTQTRDGEIKGNVGSNLIRIKKKKRHLPYGLQICVALSSILSSFGIVFALIQINQSAEQFSVSNRGQLIFQMGFEPIPYLTDNPNLQNNIVGLGLFAEAKNVGKSPIEIRIKKWHYHINDKTYYDASDTTTLASVKLYESDSMYIDLGNLLFTDFANFLSLEELKKFEVAGQFMVEYNDLDKPNEISKIYRTYQLKYNEHQNRFTIVYTKNLDEFHKKNPDK